MPTPESTMKSSPDIEEMHDFTEEERAITTKIKRHKAHEMDGITSDTIKLGGQFILTFSNNTLKTKQIHDS